MSPRVRSIVAVVVGFLVIGALSTGATALLKSTVPSVFGPGDRVDSATWLLVMQAYVFAFAVFGCWLTARLAPDQPMRHALILGVLGLVFNVVGSVVMWNAAPAWNHLLGIALVMPAAWLGGRIRERQLGRSDLPLGAPTPA